MMDSILTGERPTDVFKAMLEREPSLTNADLALEFKKHFLRVGDEAIQSIWQWRRPGRDRGIEDERMDAIVIHYLKAAGYS